MVSRTKIISLSAVFSVVFAFASSSLAKEYIVGFEQGQFKKSVPKMQLLNSPGAKPMRVMKNLELMVIDITSKQDLMKLQADQSVKFIESVEYFKAPKKINFKAAPTFSAFKGVSNSMPWGVLQVQAPEAWPLSNRGKGVKVMVLDTGIDKDHPDIAEKFVEGRNFVRNERIPEESPYDYFDVVGHGTHVAGTVLANGVGVAPEASLYVGRVCGTQFCDSAGIIAGVEWAIEAKMDVVNMSLGGGFGSDSIAQIYQKAEDANVVIVAASGNDGRNRISYPAKYPAVLSVGAIAENLSIAEFSNWDEDLDVVAPGVDVFSTLPLGTGREGLTSFTSEELALEAKAAPMSGSKNGSVEGKPLVYVGLGTEADYEGVDLSGKVALIMRGEISFADKVKGAMNANAEAAIVFNNEDGPLLGTLGGDMDVVALGINKADGEALVEVLATKQVLADVAVQASDFGPNQGTSMASPHAAGVVALVRAANSDLNAVEVKNIIRSTATATSLDNSDNRFGRGMVNALKAVEAATQN